MSTDHVGLYYIFKCCLLIIATAATSHGDSIAVSQFAAHVKLMHKERDSGFEKKYQVP